MNAGCLILEIGRKRDNQRKRSHTPWNGAANKYLIVYIGNTTGCNLFTRLWILMRSRLKWKFPPRKCSLTGRGGYFKRFDASIPSKSPSVKTNRIKGGEKTVQRYRWIKPRLLCNRFFHYSLHTCRMEWTRA